MGAHRSAGRVVHVLFLVLALADTAAAQNCDDCSFFATLDSATHGCRNYCTNCGSCGIGRVNLLDFCLCTDPSCSSSCPNYQSSSSSSRRRSSSYSPPPPPPPPSDGEPEQPGLTTARTRA